MANKMEKKTLVTSQQLSHSVAIDTIYFKKVKEQQLLSHTTATTVGPKIQPKGWRRQRELRQANERSYPICPARDPHPLHCTVCNTTHNTCLRSQSGPKIHPSRREYKVREGRLVMVKGDTNVGGGIERASSTENITLGTTCGIPHAQYSHDWRENQIQLL